MELKNKTAVVTGGASGLGEATVRRFAKGGSNVVILDLNEARAAGIIAELGDSVSFIKTDISVTENVQAAADFTIEKFGKVDILVNLAAFGGKPAKVLDAKKGPYDLNMFKKVCEVNIFGTFDVIRLFATKMLANEPNEEGGRGVVINCASVAAFEGQIGQIAYAASKAAMVGMTLPLAREFSSAGIRVCTIAPGTFDTPLLSGVSDEVRSALAKMVPFPKRLGIPDEFAQLAQQIIENGMLNGETIRLDGAIRMQPR